MRRLIFAWIIAAVFSLGVLSVQGAAISISTSQNWSAITSGSGPGGQPDSTDTITVNGTTLTVDVTSGACASILLTGSANATLAFANSSCVLVCAGSLTISGTKSYVLNMFSGGTLKIGGTFPPPSSTFAFTSGNGTIEYNSSGAQTITGTTYNHLATSGSGTKSLGGVVTLNGNLTIGSGTTLDVSSSNFALLVKGIWNNNGAFNPQGGGVTFTNPPPGQQTLNGATTFNNLTNGNGGLTLNANITVNSNLTLSAGKILGGGNVLAIGPGGTISNASSARFIIGTLQKTFNTGSGQSFTFHIGESFANYAPIAIASLNVTTAGNVTANTTAGDHPSIVGSGIDPNKSANRYWTLTPGGGLVASTSSGTFIFGGGALDAGATPTNFVVRRFDGAVWATTTNGTRTTTNSQATGLSAFGDFAVGQQLIDHYVVSAVSPQTASSNFVTTVTAQDLFNQTVVDNSTVVTMTSSTGNAQFDANGDGAFGDTGKMLTNGACSIITKDNLAETVDLIATDGNLATGTRSNLIINPAPGTTLVFIQQPTDGTAGVAISPAVTIRARDQLGNNAQGVSVTMTLKAGSSGTLSGTVTRVTDSSGVAAFNDLSINLAGSKTLRATGNSLTPVDSSAFVISGATATKLVFTTQPSGATAGAAFNTQPVVQSQDSFGNNSSSGLPASLLVSVALTSGTGPLQGTTTTDIGSGSGTPGVAAFTDLRIDILGSKQLTASASGLTSVQSSSFNVSPGAAASLQIQTQPPSTATAGSTFSSSTVVRLLDAFGNLATNDSSTVVTAARSAGTGTALLGGTTAVTAVNGVATFSTLRYDKAEAITITFSSGSLTSATSSTVTVSPAAASKLAIVVPPSTTATAGFVFAQQPQIQIQDQFGNLCTNNSTVTAARSAGSGNLQGTTNVNAVGGVATFTDLAHNVATNITILFSSSGLASTTSGTISVSPSVEHHLAIQTQPSLTATAGG